MTTFLRDLRGVTAIEFGLLAFPFFFGLFAIFEVTISYTAQQVIANASDTLAREIRTGQIDPATTSQQQFRDQICDKIKIIVDDSCPGLEFDVKSYGRFADVPTTISMNPNGSLNSTGFAFAPGGPGTINHMRVFYTWPVITNIVRSSTAGLNDGNMLIATSLTWRNEP